MTRADIILCEHYLIEDKNLKVIDVVWDKDSRYLKLMINGAFYEGTMNQSFNKGEFDQLRKKTPGKAFNYVKKHTDLSKIESSLQEKLNPFYLYNPLVFAGKMKRENC